MDRVLSFFHRNPLLSEKSFDLERFEVIVRAMESGRHRTREGFEELVRLAHSMNGAGRYRRWSVSDVIGPPEPSETTRRTPL